MLEGLDQIEWNRLSHAHGVSADVPDQLRAVAGGDTADAEQALYELFDNLGGDSTVHSASASAVPFLVELATSREVEDARRVDVLVLVARIGAARAGEAGDRRRVQGALDRGRDRLRSVLDADSAELRVAVAGLAAVLVPPPAPWARRLRELAEAAEDPLVHVHFSVAAALAEGRAPDVHDVDRAATLEPYLSRWGMPRFDGLLGRRMSRSSAIDFALDLTERALERA